MSNTDILQSYWSVRVAGITVFIIPPWRPRLGEKRWIKKKNKQANKMIVLGGKWNLDSDL